MRILMAGLLGAATALSACAAPQPVPLPPMSAEKWRADVDFFARELPKRHMNAFHAVTREQFDRAVADLRAKAGTVSDDEMIVGLKQIAASVGDAHTGVRLPAGAHRLPVSITQFGDEFRVTQATGEAKALLGGKLVRIDDVPIGEVTARLRTVISQDESEWFVRGAMVPNMLLSEVLHGLRIARDPARVRLTVADELGKERAVEVATIPAGTSPADWPSAQTTPPAVRLDPQAALAFAWLEDAKTVYVSFRGYDDLKKRSRELWAFVDSHPVQKIVIDLRQNGGGDYTDGRKYLVAPLKERPKIRPYVLIGNRSMSAAMNNAIDFRTDARATLVGQPIGEKANSYQENDEMVLPASKLVVSYSTRFYRFLPNDPAGIVKPDEETAPTWADYVAGRDPALEWALKN